MRFAYRRRDSRTLTHAFACRRARPYDAPVRVVVVRHAEAAAGEPDELRRLTPAGREQARALAERLPAPHAILTSPLLRARETADLIGRAAGVEVEVDERLAPGATAADVREAVVGREGTVVVVGHQPDCGAIAAELGAGEVAFPPAGHCVVEL
jgi:phosphohistidine phosphatase